MLEDIICEDEYDESVEQGKNLYEAHFINQVIQNSF